MSSARVLIVFLYLSPKTGVEAVIRNLIAGGEKAQTRRVTLTTTTHHDCRPKLPPCQDNICAAKQFRRFSSNGLAMPGPLLTIFTSQKGATACTTVETPCRFAFPFVASVAVLPSEHHFDQLLFLGNDSPKRAPQTLLSSKCSRNTAPRKPATVAPLPLRRTLTPPPVP